MDEATYATLIGVARIVLHTRNGPILDQIERADSGPAAAPAAPAVRKAPPPPSPAPHAGSQGDDLAFWNGFGGFADQGREYVVRLSGTRATPQPWINVIANENFGFHASAEGASFTWSRTSRSRCSG
jgi:cyclic beta-1,2-glucan synthetase